MLNQNTLNYLYLLSDKKKKDISLRPLNNDKKRIKSIDIDINKENIKQKDIDKQKLANPYCTP